MKRSFIILFFLCVSFFRVNAQNAIPITLDKDEEVPVDIYGCNLTFKKGGAAGNIRVDINLKYDGDESGNNVVLLFNKKYESEKELKKDLKMKNKTFPKITFDKKKLKNIVVNKIDIGGLNDLKILEINDDANLFKSDLDTTAIITLPVYFGKYKGKSKTKLIITDYQNMNFKIKIPEPKDTVYPNLLQAYEKLEKNVKNAAPLCPNKAHKEPQKMKQYKNDKDSLITAINKNSTYVYGQNRDNYEKLLKKVQNIEIKEEDCGRHKVAATPAKPVHSHNQYCNNKTLADIWLKLNGILVDLRKGRKTKSEAINEANGYYDACTSCPNLNKLWKKGGNDKKVIEDSYTRIKNFSK